MESKRSYTKVYFSNKKCNAVWFKKPKNNTSWLSLGLLLNTKSTYVRKKPEWKFDTSESRGMLLSKNASSIIWSKTSTTSMYILLYF